MDSATFGVIGAAYGAALGAGLWRVRRNSAADAILAALCATIATAIAAIVAQHDARLRAIDPFLERVDVTAALLAGPLLLLYCRGGTALRRRDLLHAIPAAVSLLVAVPVEPMLVHQITYTLAATFMLRRASDGDAFHRTTARLLVAAFFLIHAAQLVRMLWSDIGPLRNVVAVTGSAVVLLFGFVLAVRGARLLPRYRNSRLAEPDAARTIERLDALMRAEALYREPSLSLVALAGKLGVTPHHLSQSLNQHRRTTLLDYLAVWRVEEAKRQLLDPAREHLTIDAIAESAGFGSRSAFYTAFRRLAGVTPSELRRLSRGGER